jgi:Domain of unknown function (DUF1840)
LDAIKKGVGGFADAARDVLQQGSGIARDSTEKAGKGPTAEYRLAAHNRASASTPRLFMLYKFKSKNAGDVIMLEANGRRVLELIGKDAGPKGIIQVAEMPAALAALDAAIRLEETQDEDHDGVAVSGDGLSLRQRSVSFIDMLKRNQAAGSDVTWGV